MFATSLSPTRRIEPSHKEWKPHGYQVRAVDFLVDRGAAALFLDPGLGKTSVTLAAFDILRLEGIAKKMLVIAPLRVCQLVWTQEGSEWTQFRHLKFTTLHGSKKASRLKDDSDIFLINPEGISWLVSQFKGKPWPFDTVCIDELTKFKNASSLRHKALMTKMAKVKRRWGLTGTPIPNGYMDLFGQMKVLDGGNSLGNYFTRFRDKYFEADFSGFKYLLRRGATKQIEAAIKPYVLRMAAKDYLELPPRIDDIISVVMPKKARVIYDEMKKEMMADLEGTIVEAGNAAAVYSKLKQMANGAVYAGDGVFEPKKVVHIHDAKIEALQELIEELAGTPLLVGYEFRHDLARIQKALGGDIPYIGSGVTAAQAEQIEKDWNDNKIPVLLAHPASAGHGLNFQKGNAFHIAWFSATWDYELYDQFIKRVLRQGNEATTVFNHVFIVEDTIDNKTREAILEKGFTQDAFCNALNSEIYHTGKTAAPPHGAFEKENTMVRKLKRRVTEEDDIEEEEEEQSEPSSRKSKRTSSRGKLRGKAREEHDDEEEDEEDDVEEEEEAPTRKSSRRKFSRKVREALDEEEEDEEETEEEEELPEEKSPAKRRSRKAAEKDTEDDKPEPSRQDDDKKPWDGERPVGSLNGKPEAIVNACEKLIGEVTKKMAKASAEELNHLSNIMVNVSHILSD